MTSLGASLRCVRYDLVKCLALEYDNGSAAGLVRNCAVDGNRFEGIERSEWFPNSYHEGKSMVLWAELPFVRRTARGVIVPEGEQARVKSRLQEELANRGMFMEYVKMASCHYSADGTNEKDISTLENRTRRPSRRVQVQVR